MSYRPPIKREQWHDLEVYWFRLLHFINSVDYKDLDILKQRRILNEFAYIRVAIDIIGHLMNQNGKGETRVVAWRDERVVESLKKDLTRLRLETESDSLEIREHESMLERASIDNHIIYFFSSQKVAADALGVNQGKIAAVCKGKRPWTGGYIFQYEENFLRDQDINSKDFINKIQLGTNGNRR